MSDYVVLQKDSARVYLGGPPLVKMAIDEDADDETLGGAEMHARTSGLADYLALDEPDALRIGRDIVGHLNWRKLGPGSGAPHRVPPLYDPEELLGIASADIKVPFEAREVLARDPRRQRVRRVQAALRHRRSSPAGGTSTATRSASSPTTASCSARRRTRARSSSSCATAWTCPILFLQNITGFMVGTRYEQGGIIKDGAKLINAVSNCGVPMITLMMGASYGAGNYGMAGRAYDPRFIFSWPNHRIAVMGPKQLAGVLTIVARQKTEAAGQEFDEEAFAPIRDAFEQQVESESTALFATGRLWDDGIIDPRDTRTVLTPGRCPPSTPHPSAAPSRFGVFRM